LLFNEDSKTEKLQLRLDRIVVRLCRLSQDTFINSFQSTRERGNTAQAAGHRRIKSSVKQMKLAGR